MNLASEAQDLLRQGRLREAEVAFARVLEADPQHAEALNVLALAALSRGQVSAATDYLRRAAAAAPDDAVTLHHLGRAHDAAGDVAAAVQAHANAVRLRPEFYVGRLSWATALERAGRVDDAVVQYARALDDAQRTGKWLDPATTPAALRAQVAHAVLRVQEQRGASFARLFEPLVERFGPDALDRVARGLRIYCRQEAPVYTDPRQKPGFFFMPDLPPSPYFDRALLPWADALEAATEAIGAELAALLPTAQGRERVFTSADLEAENLRGKGGVAPDWTGHYFFRHGLRRDDNCAACPRTALALEQLPLARVRDHGPEVLFSVFAPGTHLLPHRGVTNTRVVGHLPLVIPPECALNVGGELHHWQRGRTVVFDDTYEHEAWNRSDQVRVVLIFDTWNPHLTPVEREAVALLIGAMGDFRESVVNA